MRQRKAHIFRIWLVCAWLLLCAAAARAQAPLLFSRPTATRAIALDTVRQTAEPFTLEAPIGFGANRRTRVMLFGLNLSLNPDEPLALITARAETTAQQSLPLQVEYAGAVPEQEWMSCVVVRLPDGLPFTGDALIGVSVRGQASNRVRVGFGSIGGGPPDDAGAIPTPAPFPPPVNEPDVTRYLTGNIGDVNTVTPAGPALDWGGGGTDVDAALQWMINRVRGCEDCATKIDVVVLRASGADGYNAPIFAMNGVDSVETLLIGSRAGANSDTVAATVRRAEVVFFAGGDQCRYVQYFKGAKVGEAVKAVYARGGGVGGTSAGLAIQGEYTYDGCSGSATSANALADPYHSSISFTYDFFNWRHLGGILPDTHFVTRDRMGRLFAFLARQIQDGRTASVWGVAVNERTSLVIERDGQARVMGDGPAYVVLADHAPENCAPGQPLTFSGYKIWKLQSNATFDFQHRPSTGYYLVSVSNGQLSGNPY